MSKLFESENIATLDKALAQGFDENDERFRILEKLFEKMTGKNLRQWLNGEIKFYKRDIGQENVEHNFEIFKFRICLAYRAPVMKILKEENTVQSVIRVIRTMCRELGFKLTSDNYSGPKKYNYIIVGWSRENMKQNKLENIRARAFKNGQYLVSIRKKKNK